MKKVLLIDYDLCSHTSCGRPCITKCPITLSNGRKKPNQKKDEIPVRYKKSDNKMIIIDEFCIKCNICLNVCPRNAIYSLNVLDEPTDKEITQEYAVINREVVGGGENRGFRIYGMPEMVPGKVVGLCGPNGIGKSTILNILSGKLQPNFGDPDQKNIKWQNLLKKIKKAEMRHHFKELFENKLRVVYKEQVLKVLFERHKGKTVMEILEEQNHIDEAFFAQILKYLDIYVIKNRQLIQCSGGELQRFAIASILIQDADSYLIDEPCTFLDVKKRIKLAELLRMRAVGFQKEEDNQSLAKKYPILVVEHDLTILDYMSDSVHLFYGKPHEFGVLTRTQSTKAGINSYLHGYIKTENIEFRKSKIVFRKSVGNREWENANVFMEYDEVRKTFDGFKLEIDAGHIYTGEILCIVGENGTGKSTFAKILAGKMKVDSDCDFKFPDKIVSYKPQYITGQYKKSVREFIMEYALNYDFSDAMIRTLYHPLGVDKLLESNVDALSGGQLQRVFICTCLAKKADLYVIDEPSAYLDVEERLHVSSVIRTMTKKQHATTICIEHDIAIVDALADRLFLFTGTPGKHGKTIGPLSKRDGMNEFLKQLDITFRRDFDTGRARINKKGSSVDKQQRSLGEYFYTN